MPRFWKPSILILFQGFVFVFMISWERKLTDAQNNPIPTFCGDMPPVVTIREDTQPGTVLLNFANSSIPGVTDIVFEGLEPADGIVSLNISRRAFVLKRAIDAENITDLGHPFTLMCKYKLAGSEHQGTVDIRFVIADINDNPPRFTQLVYQVNVSEHHGLGKKIFTFGSRAEDPDVQGQIREFRLLDDGDGFFRIGTPVANGDLFLNRVLDYETGRRHFSLIVQAVDDGSSGDPLTANATVIVQVLDWDDKPPRFEKDFYHLSLPANDASVVGVDLLILPEPIRAYDQDLGINMTVLYSIDSSSPASGKDYFQINSSAGHLQLLRPLDTEGADIFLRLKGYQEDNSDKYAVAFVTVYVTEHAHTPTTVSPGLTRPGGISLYTSAIGDYNSTSVTPTSTNISSVSGATDAGTTLNTSDIFETTVANGNATSRTTTTAGTQPLVPDGTLNTGSYGNTVTPATGGTATFSSFISSVTTPLSSGGVTTSAATKNTNLSGSPNPGDFTTQTTDIMHNTNLSDSTTISYPSILTVAANTVVIGTTKHNYNNTSNTAVTMETGPSKWPPGGTTEDSNEHRNSTGTPQIKNYTSSSFTDQNHTGTGVTEAFSTGFTGQNGSEASGTTFSSVVVINNNVTETPQGDFNSTISSVSNETVIMNSTKLTTHIWKDFPNTTEMSKQVTLGTTEGVVGNPAGADSQEMSTNSWAVKLSVGAVVAVLAIGLLLAAFFVRSRSRVGSKYMLDTYDLEEAKPRTYQRDKWNSTRYKLFLSQSPSKK